MSSSAAAEVLRAEALSVRYGGAGREVRALDGVSLSVREGESVAVTGPSGSGKSTLLGLLGCLARPTAGRVLFRGLDTARLSDDALSGIRSREIGFVFQSFNLIAQLDVLENVSLPLEFRGLPLEEIRTRSVAAVARVGLSDRLHHRPGELSGGEQQRVALARALAGSPRVVLADEPTGNLDSRTGEEVFSFLGGLCRDGVALVVVTHNSELARRLDEVVELRDGRRVA